MSIYNSFLKESIIFKKKIHCLECSKTPLINLQYINNEPIICYKCQDDHMGKVQLSKFLENSQNIKNDFNCTICGQLLEDNCYYCINCQIITCEKCKIIHDKEKNHNSLESYIENENLCTNHCTSFFAYCLQCKKNICTYCKNHLEHEKFIFFDNFFKKSQINKFIQSIENSKKFINKLNDIQKKIKDFYSNQIIFCDKIFNTYKKINEDEIKLCEILFDNYTYRLETHSITYPVIKNIQNILQFKSFDNINLDTQFNSFNSEKFMDFFKNITNSILIGSGPLLEFEGIEITKYIDSNYQKNNDNYINENNIKKEIKNDKKEIKNNIFEIKNEKRKYKIENKNIEKEMKNENKENKKIVIEIVNTKTEIINEQKNIKNDKNEIQNKENENKIDKNKIENNKIDKKEENQIKNNQKEINNNIKTNKYNKKRNRSNKKENKNNNKRKNEIKQKTNKIKKLNMNDIYNQKDDILESSIENKKEINNYSNLEINQDNNLNNNQKDNKKEIISNEMSSNYINALSSISPISKINENLKTQNDESKDFIEDCLNVIGKEIKKSAKKDEPSNITINQNNTLLSNNTNLSLDGIIKNQSNFHQINSEKNINEVQKDLSNKNINLSKEEENPISNISIIISSGSEIDTQIVSSEFNKSNKSINNLNSSNSKIPKDIDKDFLFEKYNELIKIIPPLQNIDFSKLEIKLIKESKNDRYFGEILGNKRYGRGIWYVDNGLYEGYFINDLANGYGKFISPNGDIYKGEWENSKKKKGIEILNNGDVFDGEYKNDHFSFGKLIYKDKNEIYEGQFKNNKKNGKGKLIVKENGEETIYEGDWFNDKLNGTCVIKYSCGDIEEAVFNNGNLCNKKKKFIYKEKKWIEL